MSQLKEIERFNALTLAEKNIYCEEKILPHFYSDFISLNIKFENNIEIVINHIKNEYILQFNSHIIVVRR